MSLAEDIKTYRKSKGHSMADVSQLTGIPADRIYKWERGTKPNDAEDFLKIKSYIRGELESAPKLNLENIPNIKAEPTPMQILSVLAEAFRDQAAAHKEQAEALKLQADILKSIESKMAQEQTQAKMDEKLKEMGANLIRTVALAEKLSMRQDSGLKEIHAQFEDLRFEQSDLSRDADSKEDQTGGDGRRTGKHRARRK